MRKAGYFLVLIFLCVTFVFAQGYKGKGRFKGIVFDEGGNPLEGVKIILYSLKAQSGFETMTDAKGKWKAFYVRGGAWNIDFEKPGYMPKKISAQIKEYDKNPDLEVKLKKIEGLIITDKLKEDLREGNKLFNEKKYEEAAEAYKKVIEESPDTYILYKNIGNCYFQMEKYDQAEEYYKKVLEKDHKNQEVMLLIGNCYANRGNNEEALEWYNKIEFEKIDDPTVLFNIGSNFYTQSKFEEALKYYKKAVEIQENFLDAIYQLGLTYLTLGDSQDAIKTFDNYLKFDQDSKRAIQVKGFIEFLKKKIEDKS
ncbi:MAG: tetratricopeptide repeat protein [Candidatus Aminicenantes bacterium]|nr:tetratricopeptide repeat protein [Candidatus Aminicenantes bacterium]